MRKNYFFRKVLDYFGVSLLLSILYLLWILYRGPISIPFLRPYIIQALNSQQNEYVMNIEEVNLELIRSIQPIKIIAKNVTLRKNDGNISIKAPKLFLSFSIRALLKGIIAPSNITIKNPSVSIFTTYGLEKNKENEINQRKIELYLDWFKDFLERFNSLEKIYPESYINSIEVQNANIEFHEVDLGHKWQFSNANLKFKRNFTNLDLSAGGVVDLEERMATLNAAIRFNPIKQKIILEFGFADVVVSDFIRELTTDITSVDVPVEGKLKAEINFSEVLKYADNLSQGIDSAVEKIEFNIKGSEGKIQFNHDEHFDYNIDAFVFDGQINGGIDSIELPKAELTMGNQKVELEINVSGYKKYFLEKSPQDLKINLKSKTNSLLMDDLARFWPNYFAEPAWEWCKENLYSGKYQNADFEFEWSYDNKLKALGLSKLKGKADIKDGIVSYLEGMPTVTEVDGTANFDIGTIDIALNKGISDNIIINKGRVLLYNLDKDKNYIDIKINGNTNVKDALRYIDHPPLEFTKDLGLNPDKIDGNVDIDLGLNFELYSDLKPEEIKVDVKAKLKNILFKDVIEGKDLKSPEASLDITEKKLEVSGLASLDEIPLKFDFKQEFKNTNYKGKGKFEFRFDDILKKELNLKNTLLNEPYISGFANLTADLTIIDDQKSQLKINADLKNMFVDYSFLGFNKAINENGSIDVALTFFNNKLQNIPFFSLQKEDFSIEGSLSINAQGDISSIDIEKITGPKTSATAKINFKYTPTYNVKIDVSGNSYDLTELFSKREKDQKQKSTANSNTPIDDDLESLPNTEISIAVNTLWTNPDTPIKNFSGGAIIKNGIGIDEMHILGNHGTDRSIKFNLDYTPRNNNEHFLTIESNNAGSTLRVLRLYENMNGGILKIEARKGKDKKMIGHAKIRDFKIYNTPLMAKLLTVASLSGILDMLKGDGLVFSHFDAPFSYENKILKITDAKMFGNVLGLTSEGTVNRATSDINIKGIISPAYSLNSMVGKIPVIGKVLAGRDGTVFALNYDISNTIDDPKININPLSILSPNSIKDLFHEEE